MKIITGLTGADAGEVKIFGYDTTVHFEQAMSKVGCLIETADDYDYLTAYQNLSLAARFYPGLGAARIDEVLELVGLRQYKNEKAGTYSLVMKQRLGLAAAILSGPEFIILDEPVNGLDIEGMVDIRNTISRLAREKQSTFFISSHLIHEIELICNRVGIIVNGNLVQTGAVDDLKNNRFSSLEEYYITRPISRFKVFASKNIAIAAFTIIMLAVVFITSFISGLFLGGLDGGGQLPAGLSQWLPAYTAAIYPMLFLGIVAAFVAQFFRSSGSALITCVFVYLAAKVMPLVFPAAAKVNPFAYTDWHVMWLGSSVTAGMLINIFLLLLSYNLIFFAAGYYLFEKKEL